MTTTETICVFSILTLSFALWLRCVCKQKSNPYDLIDHQRKMRENKEKENET
jgi:hypothetical protein